MPAAYRDGSGQEIFLGKLLGKGGEGSVHEIAGQANLVAKIYHQPPASAKASKLKAMIGLASADIQAIAAWPVSVLYDVRGVTLRGIVMPKIADSREIHELYSPAQRKRTFPNADWRYLVQTARNCAAAFARLHQHHIVVGDVNQGNVRVAANRPEVKLIDCDSFQVDINGKPVPPGVGVGHFTPPELQGAKLTDVVRTKNHDGFGLAVLIFHLLFVGRHPFAGRFGGRGDMPIEKAIQEGRFAYGSRALERQMQPPPHSLHFGEVSPDVQRLFEAAFASGQRPAAAKWVAALDAMHAKLTKCGDDPGHFHVRDVRQCPWCRIHNDNGPNFFISVSVQALLRQGSTFDVAGVWLQIQAVDPPSKLAGRIPLHATVQTPPALIDPTIFDHIRLQKTTGWISGTCGLGTIPSFLLPAPLFLIPLIGCFVFALWWLVMRANSPTEKLRRRRRSARDAAHKEFDAAHGAFAKTLQSHQARFDGLLRTLRSARDALDAHRGEREARVRQAEIQVRQRQLDDFLSRFFVRNAEISGIGPTKSATLLSNGIETAADVTEAAVLSLFGFGKKLTAKLVKWRKKIQGDFLFDPRKGVPQADLDIIEVDYHQKCQQSQRVLTQGPHDLRRIFTEAKLSAEHAAIRVRESSKHLQQAERDLAALQHFLRSRR